MEMPSRVRSDCRASICATAAPRFGAAAVCDAQHAAQEARGHQLTHTGLCREGTCSLTSRRPERGYWGCGEGHVTSLMSTHEESHGGGHPHHHGAAAGKRPHEDAGESPREPAAKSPRTGAVPSTSPTAAAAAAARVGGGGGGSAPGVSPRLGPIPTPHGIPALGCVFASSCATDLGCRGCCFPIAPLALAAGVRELPAVRRRRPSFDATTPDVPVRAPRVAVGGTKSDGVCCAAPGRALVGGLRGR